MKTLTIGPLFTGHSVSVAESVTIAPLGFQVEWAGADEMAAIPLYRYRPKHTSNRLRLDRIVFAVERLPFALDCSEYQVVETARGTYLPLEGLLSQLYAKFQVSRSIFVVLAELAELMPLSGSVRHPIGRAGLLIPQVEKKGFLLNSVFREGDRVVAEIGWRPPFQEYVFHTCLCEFGCRKTGGGDTGVWKPTSLTGVHQPLSRELRRLAPGAPDTLLTSAGRYFLQTQSIADLATAAPG